MKQVTDLFKGLYAPKMALLIHTHQHQDDTACYIESYDIDDAGKPINAHPLTAEEATGLALRLDNGDIRSRSYLKPHGLLPSNVLYIDPEQDGYVIWHTAANKVPMFFVEQLGIPDGAAFVPPLIWKAGRDVLYLYAILSGTPPVLSIPLFHAPFHNTFADGKVCMGTVKIDPSNWKCLEDFMKGWENHFWCSRFSHALGSGTKIKGNLNQLWKQLVKTGKPFPENRLLPRNIKLENITN